jgi:lysylphosphatidylglycerol synthetase-like protein (DUF2156 family)
MSQKATRIALWISTILVLLLIAAQGWSGQWTVFYVLWPGADIGNTFATVAGHLSTYHIRLGYAIGAISLLTLVFAFLSRSSLYARIFAVLAFALVVLAAAGGVQFVRSGFQDRLSLGQMADSFLAAFAANFLLLFFLNKTPKFPWSRQKAG